MEVVGNVPDNVPENVLENVPDDVLENVMDNAGARLCGPSLLVALARFRDTMRARPAGDAEDGFVRDHLAQVTGLGLLKAPLPVAQGGLGWGTASSAAIEICTALRLLGQTSLALGRVFEGHLNAIRLLHRLGGAALFGQVAADVAAGHLIGLWVTSFADPVCVMQAAPGEVGLRGLLDVCSGAGMAGRAVIMVKTGRGEDHLAYIPTGGMAEVGERRVALMGMRAAMTAPVRIAGAVPADAIFAGPGDYMAEPDFSGGAWRTSAVTVGGLEALVDATIGQLRARGRAQDPHQRARLGQMIMARETALLWIAQAAVKAEADDADPGETVACVNLARLAIEQCCLDVIPLVQRSLGLACLQQSNPVEQMMRDLSTYLRQPAGDEVLAVAADWHLCRAGP